MHSFSITNMHYIYIYICIKSRDEVTNRLCISFILSIMCTINFINYSFIPITHMHYEHNESHNGVIEFVTLYS